MGPIVRLSHVCPGFARKASNLSARMFGWLEGCEVGLTDNTDPGDTIRQSESTVETACFQPSYRSFTHPSSRRGT